MKNRLVACFYLWTQAAALSQASDEVAWAAAFAAATALLLLVRRPWRPARGWLLLLGAAVAVAVGVKFALLPPRRDPGMHIWPLLTAELLIGLQILLVASREHRPLTMIVLGVAAVCLLSSHDLQSRHDFSLSAALLFGGCCLLMADTARPAARGAASTRRRRARAISLLLVVTVLGGAVLAQQLSLQLPYARRWVTSRLSIPASTSRQRTIGFSGSGFLGSIVAKKKNNAAFPALRVYADKAPGYLRGRVFDTFDGRRWRPGRRHQRIDAQLNPPADAPPAKHFLFPVGEGRGPWRSMRIELEQNLAGFMFVPLDARYLDLPSKSLFIGANSCVLEAGDTLSYSVHIGVRRRPAPPPDSPRLLWVPRGVHPDVEQLAEQIVADAEARTSADKIGAVSSYLRSNYGYSLDGFGPNLAMNPVSHFLLNRAPSHCEYFATGTAMLLRHVGVPCRYATGFLATELEDEYGDYWLARNRDAHAWVEAYDDQRQRWVVVDSTPGIDFEEETADDDVVDAGGPAVTADESAGLGWLVQLRELATDPLGIIGIIGIVVLVRLLLAARRSRDANPAAVRRAWLERRLRRRGLRRGPAETLHQFAQRIERAAAGDPWLLRSAEWLLSYAAVRFGGRPLEQLSDPRLWQRRTAPGG